MAAKKNIIKDLRQEIRDLQDQVAGQRQQLIYQAKQSIRIADSHDLVLTGINYHTNLMAQTLRNKFIKELTWLALCDDADSKFQYIKELAIMLDRIAMPPRHRTDNE